MTYEIFDPKEPWPKSDPDFHICGKHKVDAVLVTYRSTECPLCSAEETIESLRFANENDGGARKMSSTWYYESDGGYPASFRTHYLTNLDNDREDYDSKKEALEALAKKKNTDQLEKLGQDVIDLIIEEDLVDCEENLAIWSGRAAYKIGLFIQDKYKYER
jgi:hypothetical protein